MTKYSLTSEEQKYIFQLVNLPLKWCNFWHIYTVLCTDIPNTKLLFDLYDRIQGHLNEDNRSFASIKACWFFLFVNNIWCAVQTLLKPKIQSCHIPFSNSPNKFLKTFYPWKKSRLNANYNAKWITKNNVTQSTKCNPDRPRVIRLYQQYRARPDCICAIWPDSTLLADQLQVLFFDITKNDNRQNNNEIIEQGFFCIFQII